MTFLVDILLPIAVFTSMAVVGLELTVEDFRRLAELRWGVALGLAAPIVLLPPVAVGLAKWLDLPPAVAGGLMVLSAVPPAAISNLYVALAKANTALCVTLTAVSTAVCIFTMPLVLAFGFRELAMEREALRVPVLATMGHLVLLLLLPAGIGMMVRAWRPGFAVRHEVWLKLGSLLLVLFSLFGAVFLQWRAFHQLVGPATVTALLFTLVAGAVGYGVGVLAGPSPSDRFAIAMNCSTRSFGIAATVGATFMGRTDYMAFVAAFLLTHAALATVAILLFRTFAPPRPSLPCKAA